MPEELLYAAYAPVGAKDSDDDDGGGGGGDNLRG